MVAVDSTGRKERKRVGSVKDAERRKKNGEMEIIY